MASEVPDDPSTWKMTGADKMFLELVAKFHERGIRVIMDYSWNHVGYEFWGFKDVRENQENSKYADWFWISSFDDPETPENELDYPGWFGVKDLILIRETEWSDHSSHSYSWEGNLYSEAAKRHIFNVTRKWLDPNGDGDPSDGIDGYRLDVCAELPLGFWREWRKVVREVNPDAYLVGEIWFKKWPESMMDPEPFLRGDVFDASMNYRWYKAAREFFAGSSWAISPSALVDSLERISGNIRRQNNYAMMNVAASHDSPRLWTSLYNKENRYKYGVAPMPDNAYMIHKPDEKAWRTQRMLLAHQYTYIGAPHIWSGDEMGMWGADMGDTRKPLIWPDYDFESEAVHIYGKERPVDEVKFDHERFRHYQKLIRIRYDYPVLIHGDIDYLLADDENDILAYSRYSGDDEVIAVFNAGQEEQPVTLPVKSGKSYSDILSGHEISMNEGKSVTLRLPGRSAAILVTR
jgi:glycosidase